MSPHLIYSVLGIKPGALCLLDQHSTNRSTSPPLTPSDTLARGATSQPLTGTLAARLQSLLLLLRAFLYCFSPISAQQPASNHLFCWLASEKPRPTFVFVYCVCFPESRLQVSGLRPGPLCCWRHAQLSCKLPDTNQS